MFKICFDSNFAIMLKKQMIQTKITFANIRIKYEQSGIDRKFLNLFLDKTVYIYIE